MLLASTLNLGHPEVTIDRGYVGALFTMLKSDPELDFDLFLSVTAVDWMDLKDERFEVVYHLLSLKKGYRLRVKVAVPETNPEIDTVSHLWPGANFQEREVWDMFGVKFRGHPDLRRILMYDEFVGHPLRKDYPVQAKQPRIPLLNPEVRNTALDMTRPSLVAINKRSAKSLGLDSDGRELNSIERMAISAGSGARDIGTTRKREQG